MRSVSSLCEWYTDNNKRERYTGGYEVEERKRERGGGGGGGARRSLKTIPIVFMKQKYYVALYKKFLFFVGC